MLPLGKLCAQTALQRLQHDWQNPPPTLYGNSGVSITPETVRRTGELLAETGSAPKLDDLAALIQQPSSTGTQMDLGAMTAEVDRLRNLFATPPRGLVPAVWIDYAAPTSGSDRRVAWDLTARLPQNGGQFNRGQFDGGQFNGGQISVAGRDQPSLVGTFSLQLLAGPSADNLRLVKTVSPVNGRGAATVTLQPTDRVLRAIAQTIQAQPTVFVGPPVPVSPGPNLFSEISHQSLFTSADVSPDAEPSSTKPSVSSVSLPGGPTSGGTFQEVTCPSNGSRMELTGIRQPLTPGTVYTLSGWLRNTGQFGVRYFDSNGKKIDESWINYQGPADEWHFGQLKIEAASPGGPIYHNRMTDEMIPGAVNAASFEPIVTLNQNNVLDFQDLYLGVTDQIPPPAHPDRSEIMKGFDGVGEIIEAPQGNILASAFHNDDIRCFDLKARHELGDASHLSGEPVDLVFLDHGATVVAADKQGDVLTRPTDGAAPGKIVYHAPWPVDFLTASTDAGYAAIGNAEKAQVIIVDTTTGREVSHFTANTSAPAVPSTAPENQAPPPPLLAIALSPDGKYLYAHGLNVPGRLWDAQTGQLLSLVQPAPLTPKPRFRRPPFPSLPSYPPYTPFQPYRQPFIPPPSPWINEIALARFFHIPHVFRVNFKPNPWWVQVQSGFIVGADGQALNYTVLFSTYHIYGFDTGPLAAFCLSTQSDDTYAVDPQGTLSVWKLPAGIKIPPFTPPPEIQLAPPPAPVATTAQQPGLVIQAPDALRGFPARSSPIRSPSPCYPPTKPPWLAPASPSAPICRAQNSTLPPAAPARRGKHTGTGSDGKATVRIALGSKPGKGTITITVTAKNLTQTKTVPLESIDEKADLGPFTFHVTSNGNFMALSWAEPPDNHTAFIIARQVDGGLWRTIAILPETATSYNDPIEYNHQYYYQVTITNDSKYG
jgi:hypothetical protein